MRAEHFVSVPPRTAVMGPGKLILAAIICFAIGFVALMVVPRIWPRYVSTPSVADPLPLLHGVETAPTSVAKNAPAASGSASGIVQQLRADVVPVPQKIGGALTALNECKSAIRSGETYAKVGPDQLAAIFGTRGRALTSSQLDTACRKLTE